MQISSPAPLHTTVRSASTSGSRPNLLVVGCQKSGTTWLHHALAKSRHFASSTPKEMHFFNRPEADRDWGEYLTHFPNRPEARYVMESTPAYFRLPAEGHDTAASIRKFLGDPKIIVIFRNPIDRYESAYVHHADKGRLPHVKTITSLSDEYEMLSRGHYGSILRHWRTEFPDLGVFFYDDLAADNFRFICSVMEFLELENDLDRAAVNFRRNYREQKLRGRKASPELKLATRAALQDYYRDEILQLQNLTGRDLSHWLRPERAGTLLWHRTSKKIRRMRRALLRRLAL